MKNFPVGTHVVTVVDKNSPRGFVKRGSVGVVQSFVDDDFVIKMPDGREIKFLREDLMSQRDSFRVEHIKVDLSPEEISSWIVFEFIAGSTAYGLNTPDSDQDVVGTYVLPTEMMLGLKEFQDTVVRHEPDATYHEIEKLIQLGAKGNPNVIEFAKISQIPELVKVSPKNELILELFTRWNELFLSKYVFRAYQGYAISQFKKIEQDLRNHGEIRWKHACHLLRLLWSGTQCLIHGDVVVRPKDVDIHVHNRLMEIRHGRVSLEEMMDWRQKLEEDFQSAFDACVLPDTANFEEAHKLLVRIRKSNFSA